MELVNIKRAHVILESQKEEVLETHTQTHIHNMQKAAVTAFYCSNVKWFTSKAPFQGASKQWLCE